MTGNEYTAIVTREGELWLADIPGLTGAHTFAPTIRALREYLREVAVICADLPDDAEPHIRLSFNTDDPAVAEALGLKERRERLARAQAENRAATETAVRGLVSKGYSVRDVSELVGITAGRVSQVAQRAA